MRQAPVPVQAPDPITARLTELRARATELEVRKRSTDLQQQALRKERDGAPGWRRQEIDERLSEIHNAHVDATAQLEATRQQIKEMEGDAHPGAGITVQPPPAPAQRFDFDDYDEIGFFILLLPLVLAFSRRLWGRGGPRESLDPENSPRLQRIEQAIESIAVEVERIGEAQRFTTKLLAERQPDVAPRIPIQQRREPGTITPH